MWPECFQELSGGTDETAIHARPIDVALAGFAGIRARAAKNVDDDLNRQFRPAERLVAAF